MTAPGRETPPFTPPYLAVEARTVRRSADLLMARLRRDLAVVLEDRLTGRASQADTAHAYAAVMDTYLSAMTALTTDWNEQ